MKLHTGSLPQVRQLLRQGGWFTPAIVCCFAALEFVGRQSTNDFYDILGLTALVVLVGIIAIRHRMNPLNWVGFLGRQFSKLACIGNAFKLDFGPDLRGTPPIPRKLPRCVHGVLIGLLLWTGVAILVWSLLPNSLRSFAIQGSYTLYLVGMLLLWGMLFVGALGGIYLPFMVFNYLCPRPATNPKEPRVSRGQLLFLTAYCFAIGCAMMFLPLWI